MSDRTISRRRFLPAVHGNVQVVDGGTPGRTYGLRRNTGRNVPDSMPEDSVYPTPDPTTTAPYFLAS
jgi:hypothetical protein